ncbi:MAG: hypothetical protein K0S53_762 [Bacteroidetes bacterium]|jgi:hypothetical protein|nr:hypothetical protein [Bacteroidota bacterium]MDF2451520.1 hypothetical protein [Bacteroidota bacterium]
MKLLLFLIVSFGLGSTALLTGYNFNEPASKDVLPAVLHEISGLAIIDSNTVACIQDENGILFFYDTKTHKIKREIAFGLNGDYEGITLVNKSLFILRSDGVLFEIKNFSSPKFDIKTYATQVPAVNNEGLCYDAASERLLIGAKGKINKDPLYRDQRFIYGFDLKTKSLNKKPVFQLNINDINISAKLDGFKFAKRKDKKGNLIEISLKLNTSEIAIHPVTKQLYVLSATDHCLFIFNMNGNLETITPLNPILFNKAEGLSFFPNGDLMVSNEGQAHQPTLLRFNYQSN